MAEERTLKREGVTDSGAAKLVRAVAGAVEVGSALQGGVEELWGRAPASDQGGRLLT